MKTRHAAVLLSVAALFLGCAAAPTKPSETSGGVRRAQGRLALQFTSGVPDRYEVLSGPRETYRRIAVNERLRGLLEAYTQEKSDESSAKTVDFLVHLDRVETAYRQIGARERAPAPAGRIVPASSDDRYMFDDDRPEEITKTARVVLTVELRTPRETLLRESLTAEASEVIQGAKFDPWTYDYRTVVDAALQRAMGAIDALVDRALARASL